MGLFNIFTSSDKYRLSPEEIRELTWEARRSLDGNQREMVRKMFPNGVSKEEFARAIYKKYKSGDLSRFDYRKLKKLVKKF